MESVENLRSRGDVGEGFIQHERSDLRAIKSRKHFHQLYSDVGLGAGLVLWQHVRGVVGPRTDHEQVRFDLWVVACGLAVATEEARSQSFSERGACSLRAEASPHLHDF